MQKEEARKRVPLSVSIHTHSLLLPFARMVYEHSLEQKKTRFYRFVKLPSAKVLRFYFKMEIKYAYSDKDQKQWSLF